MIMGYPASRRKRRRHEETELNITPIMNVFVLLIPFLLLTVVFAQTAIIGLALPPGEKTGSEGIAAETAKQLTRTINITDEGFRIGGTGAVFPLIPLKEGGYDYEALQVQLSLIRQHYPGEKEIIINSEPEILYEHIVKVMDTGLSLDFEEISLASAIK
jgi:biopolymer transport protein ExbD